MIVHSSFPGLPLFALLALSILIGGCEDASEKHPEQAPAANIGGEAPEPRPNPTGLLELPELGFQVQVGPFTVGPGEEKTLCGYAVLPLDENASLNRIETAMTEGSHHMNLYMALAPSEKTGTQECGNDTMGQLIVFGAQQKAHDVPLPSGIGYPLPAHQQMILEAHYINPTLEPIEAVGVANIHLARDGEVEQHAGIMALFPDSIYVPPGEETVTTARCHVPFDAEIFLLMSHMHRFGQRFDAWLVDPSTEPETRTLVYSNEDWHVPEYTMLDPEGFLSVEAGDVVEFSCTYDNPTGFAVTRGPSAQTDEMCIFGAAYVPYHGFLLCQGEGATCPEEPVNPLVDPNDSLCAQYMDCIDRCGGLNIACNNCCTPAMNPDCMLCLQGVLGCAVQNGCASGFANFDLECVAEHCAEGYVRCFVDEVE